ncbi:MULTISPECIES: phage tail domain-containing protein [unclassified Holdemanella]|uniref:phage distal tail protein n=1 Tax=unclassified Holdemanella TaxID=2633909 RepID=UPI001D0AA3C9|nr:MULTISPECIES: phage tail domain-containing protein [unclassified Holdemanella]MCB8640932.1 phage tail family protein [Holdemanella sp. DFI.5.55]MCG5649285.1 phage tail family protein [Holdemanella sp. DFI.5.21]
MAVKVIYTNEIGDSIEFSKESGIRITNIDGLSSNTISLSEATVSNQIGASVTGVSIQAKDMTLNGRFQYAPNIRKRMLAVILPGVSATLRYINTNENIDVYWKVHPKTTPVISNGVVWQNFQISLRLPYPYARSSDSNVTDFNTLTPLHRFKRSYSSKTPFKLSSRSYQPLKTIYNKGALSTGFICRMTAGVDGIKAPRIANVDTQENISFPKLTMAIGDILEISTYENERYCHLIHQGDITNVFSYMDYNSTFFQLKPGNNVIRYSSSASENMLDVRLTFDDTVAGV